jgi:hypothetical protein
MAAPGSGALLDMPGALDTRPPYPVWFGPAELESQLAQGTLTLVAVTSRALLDSSGEDTWAHSHRSDQHTRRCALVLRRLEADLAALPPTHRPAPVQSLHDQLRATHAA